MGLLRKLAVPAVMIAGIGLMVAPASAYTKNKSCTADGDTMWHTVYYYDSGANWYVWRNSVSLEANGADQNNIYLTLTNPNGFVYYQYSSPDSLDGGQTYVFYIDEEAPKSKDPFLKTRYVPEQVGFDPSCTTKTVF